METFLGLRLNKKRHIGFFSIGKHGCCSRHFHAAYEFILAPMPPIFILERASLREPRGIILANILAIKSFSAVTFSGFLKIFRPQKVKNILTFLPIAAAALAMMKEAMALSRSPEKTMRFLWFFLNQLRLAQ
mgnify:CR=1 FL=1